ncbi:Nif3-like dinuclear metal center hexameric protein [Nonlabens arenilitoris]|uniref:GTP cyclohydrolase 1 type 2 homolog n=1 Tax=Nonlabens arenilitoris TaxID=1217969 RepID=A0A2S7U793_9FLAO|nr:Nif3-like dinuclear metal center hexameric protein [Nonlabens arenilitoris]PQJ30865.1 Nif3-like dinuclear metal center hexameric protein [Nonlabens arenilitoris]
MKIQEVLSYIEQLAPRHYAEDFDNTGLLTGNSQEEVKGILVTLDCLENVIDEAILKKCNLIVTFHPIIFSGLKNLRPDNYVKKAVIKAIKNDIAIYATHTALDNAKNGVSYRMAQELGLCDIKTLIPKKELIKKLITYIPHDDFETVKEELFKVGAGQLGNYKECSFTINGTGTFLGGENSNPAIGKKGNRTTVEEKLLSITFLPHLESQLLKTLFKCHPYEEVAYEITTLNNQYDHIGMGAIGEFKKDLSINEFLKLSKERFKTGIVRHSNSKVKKIKRVALLGGSGAFGIKNAIQSGADAYITADLKYHDFFLGDSILLCDVGHFESEQFTKNLLHEYLSKKFSNFAILCADAQTNPVNYY